MKINIILTAIFLSFSLMAYSGLFEIHQTERIGSTELNGNGCVCHSPYEDPSVKVWIEGPGTLSVGQTGLYKMFLAGGPADAGGYNVAGRFGTMIPVDTISRRDNRAPNELTQAFPLVFQSRQDTISWLFEYTVSDSSETDTIFSVGLSIVYDSIPDFRDVWAYGPKFPITVTQNVTPVALTSFTAEINEGNTLLKWTTATELNNRGFDIQKRNPFWEKKNIVWEKIGFVEGKGTTSEVNEYLFVVKNFNSGIINYRLKQIDFDGNFQYSDVIEVKVGALNLSFELNQNYPNPFNPKTVISYHLATGSYLVLKVYDILGNEIAVLVDEKKEAGEYEVLFDASYLSSGLYFYKLEAGNFSEVKKMLLLK